MSEAKIIDGKAFAAGLRGRVAEEVTRLQGDHSLTPSIAWTPRRARTSCWR